MRPPLVLPVYPRKPKPRRWHVFKRRDGYVVHDVRSATERQIAGRDLLAEVVALANAVGLVHMRLLFNREGTHPADGVLMALEVGNDASVEPLDRRANPLVQRHMAQARRAKRLAALPPSKRNRKGTAS